MILPHVLNMFTMFTEYVYHILSMILLYLLNKFTYYLFPIFMPLNNIGYIPLVYDLSIYDIFQKVFRF